MSKLSITLGLLVLCTLAVNTIQIGIDMVAGTFGTTFRTGRRRWVLMEDKYIGHHPCSWTSVCDCWIGEATMRLSINCSHRYLVEPPKMYKDLDIYELDLSKNTLERTPNMTDDGYKSVRRLNLSSNRIKSINVNSISRNLEALQLTNNQISHIDKAVLDKIETKSNIASLDLFGNPLICDCNATALADFVRSAFIPRVWFLTCADTGKQIHRLTSNELCPSKLRKYFKDLLMTTSDSDAPVAIYDFYK